MPLYVDISASVHAKAGLGRYADNLARALFRKAPDRFAFFFNRSGQSDHPRWLPERSATSVRAGYKPWRMLVWLGQLARLDFGWLVPRCELFHATEHLLLPLRHVPTVLTIHDLVPFLVPEHHTRLNRWYLSRAMPLFCQRADAIICVSENSKADLLRLWGIDPSKVSVVHEAVDSVFRPASARRVSQVREQYSLPNRYLLTVGTIEPRKNLNRLLDAVASLRRRGEDVSLVVVGRKGWLFADFFARLEKFDYRDAVVLTGFVPDEDLSAVYTGARLTVLSSVYEGFGFPVLESMACGTPVVASRSSSLPEIGGDAALYFDPYNVSEMATTIGNAWHDSTARELMVQRGLTQAARFSWDKVADDTIKVYENLGVTVS